MKEIYVVKKLFPAIWLGVSKEEADTLVNDGNAFGVEFIAGCTDGGSVKITLLKEAFFMSQLPTEEAVENLIKEYFEYVESITGSVTTYTKEES